MVKNASQLISFKINSILKSTAVKPQKLSSLAELLHLLDKNALNQSTAAGAATKVNDKMRPNKKQNKKMVPSTCQEQQLGKYHLPLWKCDIVYNHNYHKNLQTGSPQKETQISKTQHLFVPYNQINTN